MRFLTNRFLHRYDPTLEDEYCTQAVVDGETYQLRILDTAGQVRGGIVEEEGRTHQCMWTSIVHIAMQR